MEIKDVRKGHLSTIWPQLTTASFILSSAASFKNTVYFLID